MIFAKDLAFVTQGFTDIIDITGKVREAVRDSSVSNGTVLVAVPGSTAGITTIEFEPGLVQDLKAVFERLVPQNGTYAHNETWGDGNGFSHVRAALLGQGQTFPLRDKDIVLGTWQQIVLVDFDNRPRQRKVVVQVMGE
jgi:secondary thiamine-phosphate synthase enzyme